MDQTFLSPDYRPQLTGSVIDTIEDVAAGNRTSIRDLWRTLVRRRKVFLAILIAFPLLVTWCTLVIPRSYTTTAKLMTGPGGPTSTQPSSTLPVLNELLTGFGTQTAESYVELLQEEPVAQGVVDQLHLNVSPPDLLKHIKATPVINTSIISLEATWSDPVTAANIANTTASVFVDRERDIVAREAISAMNYIGQQLPRARSDMEQAATALAAFQSEHSIADITNQTQTTIQALAALDSKLSQSQTDAGQDQAQLKSVESVLAKTPTTLIGSKNVGTNPVVDQLRTQLAQVDVQLKTAESEYTEQHPTVIALREQKAQLESRINALPQTVNSSNSVVPNPIYQQFRTEEGTLQGQIAAQQALASGLQRQRNTMEQQIRTIPTEQLQYTELARKAKSTEDIYNALEGKYNEASVEKDAAISDVALISPAQSTLYTVIPNLKLNVIVSLILGIMLAFAGVALVEVFDASLKGDERELEEAYKLPVLTTVPKLEDRHAEKLPAGSHKVLPPANEDAQGAPDGESIGWLRAMWIESFVRLVANLRYSTGKPLRSIAITSPSANDGKSIVALNTAIAMAEFQPRVLLVDCDLRRATLHTALGVDDPRPGITDVLVGRATLKDAIRATRHAGLDFLPSGTTSPNPAALLQAKPFEELLAEAAAEYSLVVFDTPPMAAMYDAGILGARVDGTVIVVSQNQTNSHALKRVIREISRMRGVNLLGLVLNRIAPSRSAQADYMDYLAKAGPALLTP
ncbi:MAG TPA: polysaccharide biosynthesis tyrosine autokinase [Candidatus Baltobacteraceae bacterium]